MCGRLDIKTSPAELAAIFNARLDESLADWQPHFNVRPGSRIPIARLNDEGVLELHAAHWGFEGFRKGVRDIINAKAENVAEGRMWGAMLSKVIGKSGRGFVPLGAKDGYYEWPVNEGAKVPTHLRPAHDRPWAMPLLWQWRDVKGEMMIRCATITTAPSPTTEPFHNRATAIIDDMEMLAAWMNPATEIEELLACLEPYSGPIEAYAVSKDLSTRL